MCIQQVETIIAEAAANDARLGENSRKGNLRTFAYRFSLV
jgi:hypothetical protein